MSSITALARNLRELRLGADLTQEQAAELAGLGLKFYQTIEGGRKPQLKLETIERLAKPYSLAPWQILAPAKVLAEATPKKPRPLTPSTKGPRAKWNHPDS